MSYWRGHSLIADDKLKKKSNVNVTFCQEVSRVIVKLILLVHGSTNSIQKSQNNLFLKNIWPNLIN